MTYTVRAMKPAECDAVASLIFRSTNAWYAHRGLGPIFSGSEDDCLIFTETYEDLDPGCCLVAVDDENDAVIASCFYHPRETHWSLGIMNAEMDSPHRGVAKALLQEIITRAEADQKPLRLVSSAFNLDSYSLYTRQGLAPYQVYQDMLLPVPDEGFAVALPDGLTVRDGTLDDLGAIVALERNVWSTGREKDWRYFLENARGYWHVSVAEDGAGNVVGVLGSVNHPGSNMLGPGVARDVATTEALILSELNQHRGRTPLFLVPADQAELVAAMYQHGARNCELHVGQCLGAAPEVRGVVLPTFMPETG